MPPLGGEQEACKKPDAEEPDRILVQEAESHDDAENEPELWPFVPENSDQHISGRGPEEDVERIHGVIPAGADQTVSRRDSKRREALRESAPAEAAGHERRKDDNGGPCKRGKKSHRLKRIAREHPAQPENRDGKWRLIHEPQREVVAAGNIIELVSEITVITVGHRLHRDLSESDEKRDRQATPEDDA